MVEYSPNSRPDTAEIHSNQTKNNLNKLRINSFHQAKSERRQQNLPSLTLLALVGFAFDSAYVTLRQ
jgi:hypothetical protein